jgi:hypothetical protein
MACNIEDAGFEIRDMIAWVYGSGFPKSLDISKQFDKSAGVERKIVKTIKKKPSASSDCNEGWVRPWAEGKTTMDITEPYTDEAKEWEGWGTALKPALEPITVARKPISEKTIAENILKWGTGGINIDECRVETEIVRPLIISKNGDSKTAYGNGLNNSYQDTNGTLQGRFPANLIHDGSDEVINTFPQSNGAAAPVKRGQNGDSKGIYGDYAQKGDDGETFRNDSGSAARFFNKFEFVEDDYFNYLCTVNNNILSWQDKNHPQSNVNIAEMNLFLRNAVEDFVLKLVAIEAHQEDNQLKNMITPFMNEIRLRLKENYETNTETISSSGRRLEQELKHTITVKLQESRVNYVEIQKLTNTMMIIQNLLNIDGFVEVVISDTILSNMVLGEKVSRFMYCPKSSRSERNLGCEELVSGVTSSDYRPNDDGTKGLQSRIHGATEKGGNNHPTVKPIKLMEYLIKLVSKEDAIILDPWGGSGTTGIACVNLKRQFIIMEEDKHSYDIMRARISHFIPEVNINAPQKKELKFGDQMSLF